MKIELENISKEWLEIMSSICDELERLQIKYTQHKEHLSTMPSGFVRTTMIHIMEHVENRCAELLSDIEKIQDGVYKSPNDYMNKKIKATVSRIDKMLGR